MPLKRQRLLIIDGDQPLQESVSLILERAGFQVGRASNSLSRRPSHAAGESNFFCF